MVGNLIEINWETREILIPEDQKNVGTEHDGNIVRRYFSAPATYGDVDFSEDFIVNIDYLTPMSKGRYVPEDVAVADGKITFSWLLSRNALVSRGALRFVVSMDKTVEGVAVQECNTHIGCFEVAQGIEVEKEVEESMGDYLGALSEQVSENENQIELMESAVGDLDTLQTTAKTSIVTAVNECFTNVSNGKSLLASAITDKGVQTSADASFSVMAGNIGSISGGGGSELNIHFGDTAPEDTNKLWIKHEELSNMAIGSDIIHFTSGMEVLDENLIYNCGAISACDCSDKIYLFGGFNGNTYNSICVYDRYINKLFMLQTTLPYAMSDITSQCYGNVIYLFGGCYNPNSYTNTILKFDTTNNTITTLSINIGTARYEIASAIVGGKIYLFGGRTGGTTCIDTIEIFDCATETLETLSTALPMPLYGSGACAIDNNIYLFGGGMNGGGYSNIIYIFDTVTNSFTTLSSTIPTNIFAMGIGKIDNYIYLFGGYSGSNQNKIYKFNVITNEIETLSDTIPAASYGIASVTVSDTIYLFGGTDCYSSSDIYSYHEKTKIDANTIRIQTSLNTNKFELINNIITIGVANIAKADDNGNAQSVDFAIYKNGQWIKE